MKTHIKNKACIIVLCYSVLFILFNAQYIQAHPMSSSQVEAKVIDDYWLLTLKLPNNRLTAALGKTPTEALLVNYVLANMSATSPTDSAHLWHKEVTQVVTPDDHGYWQVNVRLQPPANTKLNSIDIDYKVITEKIITHKVSFWLMPEVTVTKLTKQPKHLATLRGNKTTLSIHWSD